MKLTVEQQVRLKSLADSADEKQEIDCLIAGSIEADRPKTVSDKSLDFVALLELALLSEIIRVRVCLCVCVCVCVSVCVARARAKVRGVENAGKTLAGSNSPDATSAVPADVEGALKQSLSLKRSLSSKRAGMSD
mgnify:CR=1 FL=1